MNMQFLLPSPFARGGASEAFISFRVNHVHRSLTVIDASSGFLVFTTRRGSIGRPARNCVQLLKIPHELSDFKRCSVEEQRTRLMLCGLLKVDDQQHRTLYEAVKEVIRCRF